MDNGWVYCVYRNQAAAAYLSLYFFICLSLQFSNIKNFRHAFSQKLWGLEGWNLVYTWTVGGCIMFTGIRLLLLIPPFISSFSFSPIFKRCKFLSHFSQELWGLEGWNLVYTWTMGGCIVYTRIMLLPLFVPLFFIFLSLQFSNIKNFRHPFLRNCEA